MLSDKLKQAIKLIKLGEKQKGGQLLAEILKAAPNIFVFLTLDDTIIGVK